MYKEIKINKDTLEYEENGIIKKVKNPFTVKSFRKQLKNNTYQKFYNSIGGKTAKSEKVEEFKFPAIVYTYYTLLVTKGKVPSVEELCNEYINKYTEKIHTKYHLKKDFRPNSKDIVFNVNDLKGRICRAYNSYNREVDLLLQLFETSEKNLKFEYSFHEDFFNGVDIVGYKNEKRFDIATYFASKRSLSYKKRKNDRIHEYKNNNIDLLAFFDGQNKNVETIGDTKLYNKKAVEYILAEMKKD